MEYKVTCSIEVKVDAEDEFEAIEIAKNKIDSGNIEFEYNAEEYYDD